MQLSLSHFMIKIIILTLIKLYSIVVLTALHPYIGITWMIFLYLRRMFRYDRYYPGIIHLIFAPVGAGKSTKIAQVVKNELKYIKKGKSPFKNIICDARIKGVTYVPNIRDLLKKGMFKDSLLILEEAGISYSNRAKTLDDREREEIKLIRHYGCSAIYISQSHEDIDVVIRRLYNKIDIIRQVGNFSFLKPIWRNIDINEEKKIDDTYQFYPTIWFSRWFFKPLYYHLFDSYWIPDYIPIVDVINRKIIHSDGRIFDIDPSQMMTVEDASDMTLYEKLICNNNIRKLLKTGLYTIKGGKIVKTSIYEQIEKRYKNVQVSLDSTDHINNSKAAIEQSL